MGIIGSLVVHSIFLFLSSYIHIGHPQSEEERIIEVSLISIPVTPKKESIFIPKKVKVRGQVVPSVKNETSSLRWKPKRIIPEEMPSKKKGGEEILAFKPVRPKLDIANTYGDVLVGTGRSGAGKGKGEGEGTGEEKGQGEGSEGPFTLEITGEVARRAIFYQEGFKIPEWFERKGISLEGRFQFWVMSDGSVDRVSIEHSFGYRELDSLAMNSILRWRFASLKSGKYEEWGIAKVKIKLK